MTYTQGNRRVERRGRNRGNAPARWAALCIGLVLGLVLVAGMARAQSCDTFDQCNVGSCQADGTCKLTPRPDGTSCDDGNDCTTGDQCVQGQCKGTPGNIGQPCTGLLGACETDATCQGFPGVAAFCLGTIKDCGQGADNCTINFCNPQDGQCQSFTNTCQDQCSTGQCDPSSGECINMQPQHEGQQCDDGNECTSNDRCQSGECTGGGAAGPTPTRTNTAPPTVPPTRTPTSATSFTPTSATTPGTGGCIGDCNNDNSVTVDEIIKAVNIALGTATLDVCPPFDDNGDGTVTVDEIIKGVNAALNGCPPPGTATAAPTNTAPLPSATPTVQGTATATVAIPTATTGTSASATPTRTVSPTPVPSASATAPPVATATTTATAAASPIPSATAGTTPGPSISRRASGTIESTTDAFLVIPNILSALLGHTSLTGPTSPTGNGGGAISPFPFSFSCPAGGSGQLNCTPIIPTSPPMFSVSLTNCAVNTGQGATLNLNGTVTASGQSGDTCFSLPSTLNLSTQNLSAKTTTATGSTTATFSNFNAAVFLSGSDSQCTYDNVGLQLTGTIAITVANAQGTPLSSTQATFAPGSSIQIDVEQFGDSCVPVIYTATVDGDVQFTTNSTSFTGTFSSYTLHDDVTSGEDVIGISGGVSSACLGGAVDLFTLEDLQRASGMSCPHAGQVLVTSDTTSDVVLYQADGSVQIDIGGDETIDQTFPTCLDPALFVCPAS